MAEARACVVIALTLIVCYVIGVLLGFPWWGGLAVGVLIVLARLWR